MYIYKPYIYLSINHIYIYPYGFDRPVLPYADTRVDVLYDSLLLMNSGPPTSTSLGSGTMTRGQIYCLPLTEVFVFWITITNKL